MKDLMVCSLGCISQPSSSGGDFMIFCYSLSFLKNKLSCSYTVEAVNLCVPLALLENVQLSMFAIVLRFSPSANVFLR
jgi:hypothetical protein